MKLHWIAGILLGGLSAGGSLASAAVEAAGVSRTIHNHYIGARPMGMGNAFVAVANDYNAILYNPAGLARMTEGEVNLFLDVGASSTLPSMSKDLQDAQATPGSDADKQQAMLDLLRESYGKTIGLRTTLFSAFWARPGFGIAVIPADLKLEGVLHQSVGPAIDTTLYLDSTVALAYGDNFRGIQSGKLSWGVTGKLINRGYFSKSMNFVELASDSNLIKASDVREGFGIDADIGFLYTPVLPSQGFFSLFRLARPSFGLVVRNIAETKFSNSMKLLNKEASELPPEQMHRVIDIGTRWEYPELWIFSGRGVMDFKNLLHPATSPRKSLHLGFEFDWAVASWWKGAYRVGLNQGYVTGGVSAMFTLFNLDVVTYGEDVGTFSTPQENRMYSVRLNMNW